MPLHYSNDEGSNEEIRIAIQFSMIVEPIETEMICKGYKQIAEVILDAYGNYNSETHKFLTDEFTHYSEIHLDILHEYVPQYEDEN